MRGVNRVVISGNVTGRYRFHDTHSGTAACTFTIASDRHSSDGVVTCYAKINVYAPGLVELCRGRLKKGDYLIVEGELMNRRDRGTELTEVRAREVVFMAFREVYHGRVESDPGR